MAFIGSRDYRVSDSWEWHASGLLTLLGEGGKGLALQVKYPISCIVMTCCLFGKVFV